MAKHAGTARFAFNWALGRCKQRLDEKQKLPSAPELHREWNSWKREGAPWWREVSKCAPQEAFRDLDTALRAFFASRSGKRRGRRVGFPRFKKKHGSRDSFRLTGSIRVTSRHVTLPRLGKIKLKEPADKLVSRIKDKRCRVRSATVSRTAGRWFVSFTVENERADPADYAAARRQVQGDDGSDTIGVDLGVSCFAVLSNGERLEAPRPLETNLKKLRRLNRAHARKERGSKNKRKSARRLSRLHARVANQRSDWLHKATTRLSKSHGRIVVEDLAVANLVRNSRLSRRIADLGWGEFRRQLEYKTRWYGSELIVADRFFPSTKRCSKCGREQDVPLGQRVYRCPHQDCGLELDRDLNAARNLVTYSVTVAVSEPETQNACGEGSAGQPIRGGGTALCEAGTVRANVLRGARGKRRESEEVTDVTPS